MAALRPRVSTVIDTGGDAESKDARCDSTRAEVVSRCDARVRAGSAGTASSTSIAATDQSCEYDSDDPTVLVQPSGAALRRRRAKADAGDTHACIVRERDLGGGVAAAAVEAAPAATVCDATITRTVAVPAATTTATAGSDSDAAAHGATAADAPSASGSASPASADAYTLQRIEVRRGDAIEQIKFVYSDETSWGVGHDAGEKDNLVAVMTTGEHVVRVKHEQLPSFHSAGASVAFTTNKGRVFAYEPKAYTTRLAAECTTMEASAGYEIIRLVVRHGVLKDIVQRPVQAGDGLRGADAVCRYGDGGDGGATRRYAEWFAIADAPDTAIAKPSDIRVREFTSKAAAMAAWSATAVAPAAAILIDAQHLKITKTFGGGRTSQAIRRLETAAADKGLCAKRRHGDLTTLESLSLLLRLLGDPRDAWTFLAVTALLAVSAYLELHSTTVLTGIVMGVIAEPAGQDIDPALLEGNWLLRAACAHIAPCTGPGSDYRVTIVAAFALTWVVQRAAHDLNTYIHHMACDKKKWSLQETAYKHVLSLDQAFYDTHTMSEIYGSMRVWHISNMISWNMPYLFARAIKVPMIVGFMASMDARLTLASLVVFTAVRFGALTWIERRERVMHRVENKVEMLCNQIRDDSLRMSDAVRTFAKEQHHVDSHGQASGRHLLSLRRIVTLRVMREFGHGILTGLLFAGAMLYALRVAAGAGPIDDSGDGTGTTAANASGGTTASDDRGVTTVAAMAATGLTAAQATAFFLLLQQAQEVIGSFKWHWAELMRALPDIERFLTLMQTKPGVVSGGTVLRRCDVAGAIEFRDVTFRYPTRPGEDVLSGLNLRIQPRKVTAVVGDSGAGKSTLAKLLLRLYDPDSGAVYLDGRDLRSLDTASLRSHIGVVSQNPQLFNTTIADNIAYGATGSSFDDDCAVTREQVVAAAKLANAHEFICGFRAGYDTHTGASGTQLSGGQRQRIAIARAAIRDPQVLILDEATAALDAVNEALVQEALERIMRGRCVVVIAHRLSTIKNADEILCMRRGEVVERGTHAQLMRRGGVYADLVRHQVVGAAEPAVAAGSAAPVSVSHAAAAATCE